MVRGFMFLREKFCSDIRAGRARARLSQSEVGEQFGVSGVTISKWENGRYVFTAERFLALCFFFSLEPLAYQKLTGEKELGGEAPQEDDEPFEDPTAGDDDTYHHTGWLDLPDKGGYSSSDMLEGWFGETPANYWGEY